MCKLIDYNVLAEDYDLTRGANADIIGLFAAELPPGCNTILDFGCGTGSFARAVKKLTGADIYGVEPSDGMREKALAKGLDVRAGNHESIPFGDGFFGFIYMTDVIHHVPDINMMFAEFRRVLKPGGLVCILTESHEQLETRFWAKHFPATVAAEKKRYPDIPEIIGAAEAAGLKEHKKIVTDADKTVTVSEDFIKLVENKGYSMFRLISDEEYRAGLEALRKDHTEKTVIRGNHGETLLWFVKQEVLA
jgi:ubiquinone/menaquinone biosynthesis C-methylase UbiE